MTDLIQLAEKAMLEKGFLPYPTEAAEQEAAALTGPAVPLDENYRDMREIPWISIDNDDSKDLDQITYAEGNRIFIAIADVDALVKKGSAIDLYAQNNTTSVYTPKINFPMLPSQLSFDYTSLNEHSERCATVTEIELDHEGKFIKWDVYYAWVKNHTKLAYNATAKELEEGTASEQLLLQDKLAQRIKDYRFKQGSLDFETIKLKPKIEGEEVADLQREKGNRATELIENFMIASNVTMTRFLKAHNLPSIRRVVRTPKRWEKIRDVAFELGFELPLEPDVKALQNFLTEQKEKNPLNFNNLSLSLIKLIGRGEYVATFPGQTSPGHFDLAILDYSHTTAPNRRYPDLITQRILKSLIFKKPAPYSDDELAALAERCTQKEDDANKVERRMVKSAAALYLSNKIGQQWPAVVTGVNEHGTWVRLNNPPIEGKLSRGARGLDVGDKLTVVLIHVDVERGYIDFARV